MSNPKDVFRNAERMKGLKDAGMRPVGGRTEEVPAQEPPEEAPARVMVARPIRENSVYRQLMRSHDRMHTRHVRE